MSQVEYQKAMADYVPNLQRELEASNRRNELVTMFRAIDKDNSGGISVAELQQVSYFLATNTAFEKLLDAHKDSHNREVPQDSFVDFWLKQAATSDGKFGKWETVRTQVRPNLGLGPR